MTGDGPSCSEAGADCAAVEGLMKNGQLISFGREYEGRACSQVMEEVVSNEPGKVITARANVLGLAQVCEGEDRSRHFIAVVCLTYARLRCASSCLSGKLR